MKDSPLGDLCEVILLLLYSEGAVLRLLERYSIAFDRTKGRRNGDILLDAKRSGHGLHRILQGVDPREVCHIGTRGGPSGRA